MLRQLVAGRGCTDDAGPSTTGNPLAGLFSHLLGNSKQNEYLPEVRLPIPTFSKVDREKIRNRSHVHTRHLFPGVSQYLPCSLVAPAVEAMSKVSLSQLSSEVKAPLLSRHSPFFRSYAPPADAPPEVLEQQLQTFLQSLNIADPASTADDPKYHEFLTGEPHQAAAHIDWTSEYQHQHAAPSQNRQSPQHSLPEQQAHEEAWGTARQAPGLKPQPHLPPKAALASEWADVFHQSHNSAPHSWAEDFSRLHLEASSQQPVHSANPSTSWVSDFQSQRQQPQPADQPWAEQFLAGDEQRWAEQFATEQQEQVQQRELTPEEQKALRGAQPDDPLDDKAALSWVRQFNEEAAKPSVNFGMFCCDRSCFAGYTAQACHCSCYLGCYGACEGASGNDSAVLMAPMCLWH